ncbi:Fungal trans [Geosmithia morbida]|uniref:Fungal trans n=1 Tax=Geosmithia morbida TaxID=1094350 RepID=A0A9P4YYK6_9HYPO|nr:Fungal trans [Geosmithia morbida]KAF4125466.1 Fungal trans [Geosmithia morbida]
MIDDPPLNDFEWCEREVDQHVHGLSPDAAPVHESPRSDGMASLSVAERETGYLGVASGAALLRLLDPRQDTSSPSPRTWRTPKFVSGRKKTSRPVLLQSPNPNRHISEAMIDAYFRLYHVHYPIIHEPTFRAQYSEVIHRPHGSCWTVLAYIVAAIGAWSSSSSSGESLDLALFSHARSMLDFNFLEVGNLSLVQALTLASNYQQKRDKPNSGYNYLGLAVRMAMGLGLHKEFQGWSISPLTMEIRRRVWWSLCVFDVGATITFSRPEVWPYKGVEDLTAASQSYPPESHHMTPYTAVATQARFHVATHACYERVISKPQPSSDALLTLDAQAIEPWIADVPSYFAEDATVPHRYALSHAIKSWRLMNLRIIMYRPFVIRKMLKRSSSTEVGDMTAFHRCLDDVRSTINLISDYWRHHEHNFLTAWYSLYFLFQATLIPCICLRNAPNTSEVDDWRAQIGAASNTIAAMAEVNSSATRCHRIILNLCGKYLDEAETGIRSGPEYPSSSGDATDVTRHAAVISPEALADSHRMTGSEAPQASHNPMIGLMWPHVPPLDAVDMTMGDEMGWMDLLAGGGNDL